MMRRRAVIATLALGAVGLFVASRALAQQPGPGVKFPAFDAMDANKDGRVTRDEFLAALPADQRSVGARVFDARDANKDGVITRDEMEPRR